jgi:hypothetical protein
MGGAVSKRTWPALEASRKALVGAVAKLWDSRWGTNKKGAALAAPLIL